jgi:hypothetical protein
MFFLRRFARILPCLTICVESVIAQLPPQTESVVRGVRHFHFVKSGPYDIHVLEVDLHEPSLHVESYRPLGLVKTTDQVRSNNRPGHRVVAAINGDFFSFKTCFPLGNQLRNNEFVVGTASNRSHFGINSRNQPFIERFTFHGSFIDKRGRLRELVKVNQSFTGDSASLFTSYWVDSSNSMQTRRTYIGELLNGQWRVGDTMRISLVKEEYPPQGMVHQDFGLLSLGYGTMSNEMASSLTIGDTLRVFLDLTPHINYLEEVVGGAGRILRDGKKVSDENVEMEEIAHDFVIKRHPRTFVGFNQDSTLLYLCTVDGRQSSSIGMNFDEMADFSLSIGIWNGVNLDGGGSTAMVILDNLVNSPSDKTGERKVANSLQVIQTNQGNDR